MKLVYISPLRYPSEKAGSQFSMESCAAFANCGAEVELWAPQRWNPLKNDPYSFHGVERNFKIVQLPSLDLNRFFSFFYPLLEITFAFSVFFHTLRTEGQETIFYSHEEPAIFLLSFIRRFTVYENHDFPPDNIFYKWFFRRIACVITTNAWKESKLMELFRVSRERIFRIVNAVSLDQFMIDMTKNEARAKLGIKIGLPLVLYTGHLYSWKGVDTLFNAAPLLEGVVSIFLVGGTDSDILHYRIKAEQLKRNNIQCIGRMPHEEMPVWLRAADLLVIPNTAKEDISKYYTSPMKLFEYMAAARPIVASDLPSIREIVGDDMVWFFSPDNSQALAKAIESALSAKEESERKSERARDEVRKHTWEIRAGAILAFLRRYESSVL